MRRFKLTILHTSDVHGYVMPYNYSNNKDSNIGLSKLSTLIKQYRTENSLLIDTGDTIQGSALTYYYSLNQETINPISKVYNYLNYDYSIIGNHDFNYGQTYLTEFLKDCNSKVLAANIFKNNSKLFDSFDIKEFEDGPTVAIVGLTTHFIPNWENPINIKNMRFDHELETLKLVLSNIRRDYKVDLIIVGYHGGFENDIITGQAIQNETGENNGYKMLDLDIDVLLSGHQHRFLAGEQGGVSYTQPGFNGSHLGLVEVNFSYEGKWKVASKETKIISTSSIKGDSEIIKLIKNIETKTQEWLDTPIGRLSSGDCLITDPLLDRINKNPMVTLINSIQMEATNTDISCTSLGNSVMGFNALITMRDIISTYIYPNTLVVLEVTGKDIKDAIEKSAEFFTVKNNSIEISEQFISPKLELYNYDMFDGLEYIINLSNKIGDRATKITHKNAPLDMKKNYKVVMNNYRAAGGGNYTMFKNKKVIRTVEKDMVDIIADYILKYKVINLERVNNIKLVKND
ncbi:bifunctional metallophosphatase/5'-nucleotidase [Mycoplasmatota bacterium]|nr:bifunctional metallophosphatase/5'-nucleotidase [Mycoplasmatota bacterium]